MPSVNAALINGNVRGSSFPVAPSKPMAAARTPAGLPAAKYLKPRSSARLSPSAAKPLSPDARIVSRHEGKSMSFIKAS